MHAYFSTSNPLASNISLPPSGRNVRVGAGTVIAEKENFWSYSVRHLVRKCRYRLPVYLTIFPEDLSVRSRTPTLLTTTLSAWWKATLHCSHLWTLFGQSFPSSLLTSSYWFLDILSGSRKFAAPVAAVGLFSTYEVKLYLLNMKSKSQARYYNSVYFFDGTS